MLTFLRDSLNPKLAQRVYVDLIYEATSMYANLIPSSSLKLGDYGDVNKQTGEFVVIGNFFEKHPYIKYQTRETREGDKVIFASRRSGFASSIDVTGVPDMVECSLKAGWNIKRDRHAALVLVRPVLVELLNEGSMKSAITNKGELRNKAIVTKLFKCSSYAILLTNGGFGDAHIGFKLGMPQAHADADANWLKHSDVGSWSTGWYDPSGGAAYVPLATLRAIRPIRPAVGYRATKVVTQEEIARMDMLDFVPPWGDLDENGLDMDCDEEEGVEE